MSRDWELFLADVAEAGERILDYTRGLDREGFLASRLTCDAVLHNLEILGEAVKHLPESLRGEAPGVDWRGLAGLRDILAHAYFGVDLDAIWEVVVDEVPAVLEFVNSRQPE